MSVQREHREIHAAAGEPAGGLGPNLFQALLPSAGRRILLLTPSKLRKWSTSPEIPRILPALFAVSERSRFHPRAAANLRPCSKSENSPAIFATIIHRIPDLHTALIHAQAAGIMIESQKVSCLCSEKAKLERNADNA